MLIFDQDSNTIQIESLTQPIVATHFWVLDLPTADFMLSPLNSLEQVTCPTLEVTIGEFSFNAPAAWNIMIYDVETHQVDVVSLAEAAGREFTAFGYGPTAGYPIPLPIRITNYYAELDNISPSINKQQMLCHPVSDQLWVCLSSSDGYNRHLKTRLIGSFISGN